MNTFERLRNRTIKLVTLPNGIRCCFVHDLNQEDVGFILSIGGGSESQSIENSDIASFCLRVLLSGSMLYPGVKNFKEFITDNEMSFFFVNSLSAVQIESTVPEFALHEFLQRVSDAFDFPEFSPKAFEYATERLRSWLYYRMHDDKSRLMQIRTMVMSDDAIWGNNFEQLFVKNNLQLLVEEYYSKFFKPSNMSLTMVSSLSLEEQYKSVIKSLGLLSGIFGSPQIAHPLVYKRKCQKGELFLTKAFTMNPKAKMVVSCLLPGETSASSSLYLGYLFVMSYPGSINYYLKNEGLITGITVDHVYWKKSLQTLDIIINLTEDGVQKFEKILSKFVAYMELVKCHDPSKILFDQSRQHFLNLRLHEDTLTLINRIHSTHSLSKTFELYPNDDDLLFPDVPHCFDPLDIFRTVQALESSDLLVFALSNKFVHTQMHPRTDLYLKFSSAPIKIAPCFDELLSPNPSIIINFNEDFSM